MFQISICPGCHRRFLFNLYEECFCPECGHPLIDRCSNPRCRKTIDRATGDGCPDCGASYFCLRPIRRWRPAALISLPTLAAFWRESASGVEAVPLMGPGRGRRPNGISSFDDRTYAIAVAFSAYPPGCGPTDGESFLPDGDGISGP